MTREDVVQAQAEDLSGPSRPSPIAPGRSVANVRPHRRCLFRDLCVCLRMTLGFVLTESLLCWFFVCYRIQVTDVAVMCGASGYHQDAIFGHCHCAWRCQLHTALRQGARFPPRLTAPPYTDSLITLGSCWMRTQN